MIVMKFGGTSVGTAQSIRTACTIVKDRLPRNPFVVVSAHNSPTYRMTDTLIDTAEAALDGTVNTEGIYALQHGICQDLGIKTDLVDHLLDRFARLVEGIAMIGEISPRTMDLVQSFGERMSCLVVAEVMRTEFQIKALARTSMELGLATDGIFGAAHPDPASYPTVARNAAELDADVIVSTGFLGTGPDGHITTLGRGGSDYSATIFGVALGAEEVEIWTDVDGVMSADPKIVPTAQSIPELTFTEASELAWFGAKVLHPSTMKPAIEHDIPVRVLNTHRPHQPGTLICPQTSGKLIPAKSIANKQGMNLMTVSSGRMLGTHGFMASLFEIFSRHKVDIHMIATSEVSVSLTTPQSTELEAARPELESLGDVVMEQEKALVCVVGEGMAGTPGIASRVCKSLADKDINIHMISQGASELNIALLVNDVDMHAAVQALHGEFFNEN